jgi:hypothetical protein
MAEFPSKFVQYPYSPAYRLFVIMLILIDFSVNIMYFVTLVVSIEVRKIEKESKDRYSSGRRRSQGFRSPGCFKGT